MGTQKVGKCISRGGAWLISFFSGIEVIGGRLLSSGGSSGRWTLHEASVCELAPLSLQRLQWGTYLVWILYILLDGTWLWHWFAFYSLAFAPIWAFCNVEIQQSQLWPRLSILPVKLNYACDKYLLGYSTVRQILFVPVNKCEWDHLLLTALVAKAVHNVATSGKKPTNSS